MKRREVSIFFLTKGPHMATVEWDSDSDLGEEEAYWPTDAVDEHEEISDYAHTPSPPMRRLVHSRSCSVSPQASDEEMAYNSANDTVTQSGKRARKALKFSDDEAEETEKDEEDTETEEGVEEADTEENSKVSEGDDEESSEICLGESIEGDTEQEGIEELSSGKCIAVRVMCSY